MKLRPNLLFLLFSALSTSAAISQVVQEPADRPPNVVFVFIDDMGYGDLSVTGNPHVQTANIDRLAEEGTRFTQFYVNAPICSPSRVAVTTGMYPARWEINSFIASRERNRARNMPDYLDSEAPTLARTLKNAGYATGHFGKWHMGGGRDVDDAPLPTSYGFDASITSFEGLGDRFLFPGRLSEQSAQLGHGDIEWTEKSELTRIYVDHAIDFIRQHQDRPFYINVWPDDVHDPFVPRPELADKYADVAQDEYEQQFFAVLDEMDRQLGRLFDELDNLGLAEETLVVLTSDNGPTDWPRYYEDGGVPPGSSGPFYGRKWSLYEGGIRMPLIVRWPGKVPAGVVNEQSVFAAFDLVPTLSALAGADPPESHELDGEDVRHILLGEPVGREKPLYWYYPGDLKPGNPEFESPSLAVRDGRWKLLVQEDGSGAQLYDLESDPGEQNNLADAHHDIVERLSSLVLDWRSKMP